MLLLFDETGEVLFRRRFPTPAKVSPETAARAIKGAVDDALAGAGVERRSLAGIGVCVAALINFERGEIFEAPNLDWHEPVPFREMLGRMFSCPVCLDNDANAAVLGEAVYGAARGHRNAAYITVSTGIGGGLFLDGKVYRGAMGFAGEVGHTKPFGRGRKCGCGGPDCLEAWASGGAIARNAALLWEHGPKESEPVTTAWVFDQAEAGNTLARKIIDESLKAIGTGLANLVTLLNPTCLVIGGGVTGNRPNFLERLREEIFRAAIAPAVLNTPLEVTAAKLEPESGAWGMYALISKAEI